MPLAEHDSAIGQEEDIACETDNEQHNKLRIARKDEIYMRSSVSERE